MKHPFALMAILSLTIACGPAAAQTPRDVPSSPNAAWGDPAALQQPAQFSWVNVALWIPNRLMDLLDIFRADLGLGPSYGGVVRLTRYAQGGYRSMAPGSFRLGFFGRAAPYLNESSDEYGIGPYYQESLDREVCPGEIGFGADVLLAGVYGGVCVDELADFAAGLFFIDLKGDDLR
jgi:hypothetical protein